MDEAGVTVDPRLISHGHFQVEEGIERGRRLLARRRPADGDLRRQRPAGPRRLPGRARDARLHIPEDLSVVGFDDFPIAHWVVLP